MGWDGILVLALQYFEMIYVHRNRKKSSLIPPRRRKYDLLPNVGMLLLFATQNATI